MNTHINILKLKGGETMEKCKECGHNGSGLHLCRGGNLFKKFLEIEIMKLKKDVNK